MHEAPLGVARLRPGIGEQQEQPVEAARPAAAAAAPAHRRSTAADCRAAAPSPRRPPAPGATAASRCRSRTPRRRSGRPPGCARDLRQRVLAAAEADLQPQLRRPRREGRQRIGRLRRRRTRSRGSVTSSRRCWRGRSRGRGRGRTAGPAAASAARRLTPFSAGTRSVFSHVKVPFSSSGSRPKWP